MIYFFPEVNHFCILMTKNKLKTDWFSNSRCAICFKRAIVKQNEQMKCKSNRY